MKFSTKIFLTCLAFNLATVIPLGIFIYFTTIQSMSQGIIRELNNSAHYSIDKMERNLFERQGDIQILASDSVIKANLDHPDVIADRLRQFRDTYRIYSALSFFNVDKVRIADSSDLALGSVALGERWVTDVFEYHQLSIAKDVYFDPILKQTIIVFAAPVINGEQFLGAVVAYFPIDGFKQIFDMPAHHEESNITSQYIDLIDNDGLLIYSNYRNNEVLQKQIDPTPSKKMLLEQGTAHAHEDRFYISEVEKGYLDFAGNGWTLMIHYPKGQVFGLVDTVRNIAILLAIVLLLIAIFGIFFITRRMLRPISQLQRAAHQVSCGNFNVSVPVSSYDEIGQLTRAFNQMTQILGSNMIEMLQQEVAKQTEEIAVQNEELQAQAYELGEQTRRLQTEIQHREAMSQQLQENRNFLNQIVDNLPIALCVKNVTDQFRFIIWNKRMEQLFGISRRQVLGRTDFDLFLNTEEAENYRRVDEAVVAGHQLLEIPAEKVSTVDGFILSNTLKLPLYNREGQPESLMIVLYDITKQKQTEEQLRQQQNLLKLIINNIPQMVFWKDTKSVYQGCNHALADAAKLSHPDEIIGKMDYDLIWSEYAAQLISADQQVIQTNQPKCQFVEKMVREGITYWYNRSKIPLHDANGHVIGVLGTTEDITSLKKAEELLEDFNQRLSEDVNARTRELEEKTHLLQAEQHKFTTVLNSLEVFLYVVDMQTFEILFINDYAKQLLGHDVTGAICWQTLYRGQTGQCSFCTNDKLLTHDGKPSGIYTWEFQHPDSKRWYYVHDRAIYWTDGRLVRFEAATDITLLKKAEIALSQKEQRLQKIFETNTLGLCIVDNSWKFTHANNKMLQLFGYSMEEFQHLSNADITYHEDVELTRLHVQKLMTGEIENYHLEKRYQRKDGSIFWGDLYVAGLVRDEQGNLLETLGIIIDITERKRVEEALRKSEERFNLAMQGANDGVWDWDLQRDTIYYSPRWKSMLGYEPYEMPDIPAEFFKRVHPDDVAKVTQHVNDYLERKSTKYEFTVRLQHKNEDYIWVLSRGQGVWDTDGKAVRIVGMHTDLTPQKQAEAAIRDSEERFKKIFEAANICMAIGDKYWNFTLCNTAMQKTFGYSETELKQLTNLDLTVLDDVELSREKSVQLARGEIDSYMVHKRYKRKDGNIFWGNAYVTALSRDEQGYVRTMLGIIIDVNDQKLAEEALQTSKAELERTNRELYQFKATLDLTLDCVLMNDPRTTKYFYANQGAVNQLGYTREEFLELTPTDLAPHVDRQKLLHIRQALVEGKQAGVSFEAEFQRKDSVFYPVEIFLQYIRFSETEARFIAIVRDITERKQAEQKLLEAKQTAEFANQAKSTFLANMSHELRTPLNGILGYAQILLRDKLLNSDQREGIKIIQRSGDYLLTLINDVLDLAKIEANRIELYITDIDFNDFLQGIVELFQMRAQQKGISFYFSRLSHLPEGIRTDEKRLRQVLINLLGNAVKFTKQGGVTFKVGYHETQIRFQIEDTGVGIAQEELDKIFDPFQQVGDEKYRAEGTGLGLSITKKLVEMMGGNLGVESTLYQGSIFWIDLTLEESDHLIQSTHEEQQMVAGYRTPQYPDDYPIKLLVVDDKWENRSVIVKLLQPLGFELFEASQGEEGLQKLHQLATERNLPDLIFTDLVMPVLDGFEFTRRLKQLEQFKHIPVVAATASVFDYDQADSVAAGCSDFLTKPIRSELLLESLRRNLNLEWIYETNTPREKLPLPQMVLSETMIDGENGRLTLEQAANLYDLGMMGDIEGILKQITLLEQEPHLVVLTQQLRHLAEQFRIDEICESVRPFLGK